MSRWPPPSSVLGMLFPTHRLASYSGIRSIFSDLTDPANLVLSSTQANLKVGVVLAMEFEFCFATLCAGL